MRITEARSAEPVWEDVAYYKMDFRPHFKGDFVNLYTTIDPLDSIEATESLACDCFNGIAEWLLSNRKKFGREDAFQIIIGWSKSIRETGRHIIKGGGTWKEIERISTTTIGPNFSPQWSAGVKFVTEQDPH